MPGFRSRWRPAARHTGLRAALTALKVTAVLLSLAPTAAGLRPGDSDAAALDAAAVGPPACLDGTGLPVDWWVLLKAPGDCESTPWVRGNVSLYVDARSVAACSGGAAPGACWHLASIDDPLGALQRTLAQLEVPGTGTAMYSDQPPYHDYDFR